MTHMEVKTPIVKLNSKLQCWGLIYAYILVKRTISIVPEAEANPNNNNNKVVFRICAPLTDWISEINNTQLDNTKDIDVVTPMHILIKYSNNYSKTSWSLWQYYRDELFLDAYDVIANFPAANNNNALFKIKQKIAVSGGTKDAEIMVLLKYLSNFWRTLEMTLINCEINLTLTWFDRCVLSNDVKQQHSQ